MLSEKLLAIIAAVRHWQACDEAYWKELGEVKARGEEQDVWLRSAAMRDVTANRNAAADKLTHQPHSLVALQTFVMLCDEIERLAGE